MIGQLQTDAYKFLTRIKADSGSIIDEVETRKSIDNSIAESKEIIDSASLVMIPTGSKSGKLHSLKPTDGTGDFTVARNSVKWVLGKDGYYHEVPVNTPALEWSPTAQKFGVLTKAQRTNLLTRSWNFKHAAWNPNGVTVDDNAGAGYDCPFVNSTGVNLKRGFKLTATGANGYINLATALTVTAATAYSNSIFVKRLTGTGAVSLIDTNGTYRAITVTSDWQRFTYTATSAGTTGQIGIKLATSGDEVMICQSDVVEAAAAGSPIFTDGATVTRLADVISKTGISTLIGQTEGTLVFQAIKDEFTGSLITISDGSDNNRIQPTFLSNSSFVIVIRLAGANLNLLLTLNPVISLGLIKLAIAYKVDDYAVAINGTLYTSTATRAVPACSVLNIGGSATGVVNASNNISNVIVLKTRISNDELIRMTT